MLIVSMLPSHWRPRSVSRRTPDGLRRPYPFEHAAIVARRLSSLQNTLQLGVYGGGDELYRMTWHTSMRTNEVQRGAGFRFHGRMPSLHTLQAFR